MKTRNKTANPAAFGPTDMNPVTGVGAPSYTSGVQMWNGATATLKQSAIIISAADNSTRLSGVFELRSACAMPVGFVLPVAPKIRATPYRKNAEENDPSRKYFSADSFDLRSVLRK